MTKYILNSGGLRNQPELKRKFHLEIINSLDDSPKILICTFAQAREYWETKYVGYSNSILQDMPERIRPTFELAMPSRFIDQCVWADAIWFSGGDDHLVQYWLKQFDYTKLFAGKVIATSSASSNMLVRAYWTCDWRACQTGLNIIPIKFIAHYNSTYGAEDQRGPIDWDEAYAELANYRHKDTSIFALQEGEYIVREID